MVYPLGFYKYEWMPFGLMNAPAMFLHLMETCLGNLLFQWCIIYLDDIIIFAATPKEHLKSLHTVHLQLWAADLKLQPAKCVLFKPIVVYLRHKISKEGIWTDGYKVEAIKNWPIPVMVTKLQSFLGLTNYYQHFIKEYTMVSHPLYDQISGNNATLKKKNIQWMEECQEAFSRLKVMCTPAKVLAFADFKKWFKLQTDASTIGLGTVLCQEQGGKDQVIGYASRALSKSESGYPAHKLEFLALKWTITECFQEFLYSNTFASYSDNNPLTCVLTTANLNATRQRWITKLTKFNVTIYYHSGKSNINADALSWIPWD